ncbi:MAG: nucleotide sugar dehydrogenase [Thaumarchaeota archaeon]|nr:nucleotide sugar dehydrogenase [Nitrososphaerota archaeon]
MVGILNLNKSDVIREVRNGNVTISVVGLGYVGLPLATLFATEGARIVGADISKEVVEKVNRGESPIVEHDVMELLQPNVVPLKAVCPRCAVQLFSTESEVFCPHCQKIAEIDGPNVRLLSVNAKGENLSANRPKQLSDLLAKAVNSGKMRATSDTREAVYGTDVVLITVGTPIDDNHEPNTEALTKACHDIGHSLTKDTLVILKSTVSPGTTEDLVAPILSEDSGLVLGEDFGLAHMPERIKEGMALYEFRNLARIVAGMNERSALAASSLFSVFPAPTYIFRSPRITEASKLFENIYRDVNISLANELALISQSLGIDIMEVIEAAQTDPKTHLLLPGPGVGGYCLTKDSFYLTHPSSQKGFIPTLIPVARSLNDEMPLQVVKLISEALGEAGMRMSQSTITLLGLAFKGNSGDLRNTPVIPIAQHLLSQGAKIVAYDPLVDPKEVKRLVNGIQLESELKKAITIADCLVITADHSEIRKLKVIDIVSLDRRPKAIVDTRHVFDPTEVRQSGLTYRGVGRGILKAALERAAPLLP